MGKALYRTFRSMSFDELIGQDHITKTLKNALEQDTISHAYLLTGPRGVGKTSVARILAHEVNGLPYSDDSSHVDIVEIDAASNRRIDEIRELRERVHIAPTTAKYKVYIIDEVHMLTKEAFNALLKTLEEPPAHVIFILATTDFHKLPETIVSRCLRLTFKPISTADVAAHLRVIAKKEKLTIDDDALTLIAEHGNGSFRDSISLLDQVRNIENQITADAVEVMLGRASATTIDLILGSIANGDAKSLVGHLTDAYTHGANELELAKQIAARLREELINGKAALGPRQSLELLRQLLAVPAASQPKALLELVLLDVLLMQSPRPKEQRITEVTVAEEAAQKAHPAKVVETPVEPEPEVEQTIKPLTVQRDDQNIDEEVIDTDELWQATLQALKERNNTLYGVARMANVSRENNTLILSFQFAFHYRKIGDAKSKAILWEILQKKTNEITGIQVEHQPKEVTASYSEEIQEAPDKKTYENITNIFGSSEVLES